MKPSLQRRAGVALKVACGSLAPPGKTALRLLYGGGQSLAALQGHCSLPEAGPAAQEAHVTECWPCSPR